MLKSSHRQIYERLGFAALFFLLACAISPRLAIAQPLRSLDGSAVNEIALRILAESTKLQDQLFRIP